MVSTGETREKVKQEKTPGKDQPHRQKENRGRVSGLVLKTKKMWPGRSCKGGKNHREPKRHVFYDTRVAFTSHTVSRNAGTQAGGRQWLERCMGAGKSLAGCMQDKQQCVKACSGPLSLSR